MKHVKRAVSIRERYPNDIEGPRSGGICVTVDGCHTSAAKKRNSGKLVTTTAVVQAGAFRVKDLGPIFYQI